jgi:glycosyltransferase involved in cell wall biosynthesis
LHARASFGSAKGTEYIRSVIAQLQLTHNIEFTEMIGVSKQQLAQAMSNHDLLIDQAYSDYPLPVISAEAMARGLPSLVCGYFKDEYRPYLKFDPPVLTSRPENLEALMRELLNWDDDDWTKLKDSSYAFVSAHFRTEEVALKLLSVIAGGTNQSDVSITNRKSITYFQGAGTSESVMRAIRKSRIMKFSPGRKWAFPPKE